MRKTVQRMLFVVLCVLGLAVCVSAVTYTGDFIAVVNTKYDTQMVYEGTVNNERPVERSVSGTQSGYTIYDQYVDEETGRTITITSPVLEDPVPVEADEAGNVLSSSVDAARYSTGNTKTIVESDTGTRKTMKCLYIGTYCTVWGSTSEASAVRISTTQAKTVGQAFDQHCQTVVNTFGDWFDADFDGKVAILCHDIDSSYGTDPDTYTAGYFHSLNMINSVGKINGISFEQSQYALGMDCIHIDTYPGMGTNFNDIPRCYGTLIHEFQHMIAYSYQVSSGTYRDGLPTYLNEAWSMAAEHLVFGASELEARINYFNDASAYTAGFPLTYWTGDLDNYSNSYLFGQYLRTRYAQMGNADGSGFYRMILQAAANTTLDRTSLVALKLGTTPAQLLKDFWTAVLLRESSGVHGFNGESWADKISPIGYVSWPSDGIGTVYNGGVIYVRLDGSSVSIREEKNVEVVCTKDGNVVEATDSRKQAFSMPSDVTDLTLTDGAYPWACVDGRIQSTNKAAGNTTSTLTVRFTTKKAAKLRFDYGVSSESGYDKLKIVVDSKTIANDISGSDTGVCDMDLAVGSHTITFTYTKDSSVNSGDDCGWFENFKVFNKVTSGSCGSNLNWSYDENTGKLSIVGTGAMYDYEFASSADPTGQVVPWIDYRFEVSSVSVGSGVTSIGDYAFEAMWKVENVVLPATVTSIGSQAFSGCQGLTSITLPDALASLGEYAFVGSGLKEVEIPSKITVIPKSAFQFCQDLQQVTIPAGVKKIDASAFKDCTALTDVYYDGTQDQWNAITIASGNEPLADAAIHCMKVDRTAYLSLPSDVSGLTLTDNSYPWTYTNGQFQSANGGIASSESTLTIRFKTTKKSTLTFDYGVSSESGFDKMTITADDRTIAADISGEMTGTCTQTLAVGTHTIKFTYKKDGSADRGSDLAWFRNFKVEYADALSGTCGDDLYWSFDESTGTLTITGSGDMTDFWAGLEAPWTEYRDDIVSLELSDQMTSIGDGAFEYCPITEVVIPDSVTRIGTSAFYSCTALKKLDLGSGVETIGSLVFNYNIALTTLRIPDSVTQIGDSTFGSCYGLETVVWGAGMSDIEENMFADSSALKQITIPVSVKEIKNAAFAHCDALSDVYYEGSKSQWEAITIADSKVNGLANATIHYGVDEEIEQFELVGANMTLGNDLKMNFMIKKSDMHDGYVAMVSQAGGEPVRLQLWSYNAAYYAASYSVAAKEMTDELSVEIYNADGDPVSKPFTRTVKQYAMTLLNNASQKESLKRVIVDMLNYGTEAQKYFGHNEGSYANADVTAAQQSQYATANVTCTNNQVAGTNFVGANLSLEDSILLNVFFKGITNGNVSGITATVSYIDYLGKQVTADATVTNQGTNMIKVVVNQIVLADAKRPVTVTVYKNGVRLGSGVESVESYIARNLDNATMGDLNLAIMKFAASAYNHLGGTY